MAHFTKVAFMKMKFKVLVYLFGQTKQNMKEIGFKIPCMVKESYNGLMVGSMKGNFKMIRRVDLVYLLGVMAENMKDSGLMVSSTEVEFILIVRKNLCKVPGFMEKLVDEIKLLTIFGSSNRLILALIK